MNQDYLILLLSILLILLLFTIFNYFIIKKSNDKKNQNKEDNSELLLSIKNIIDNDFSSFSFKLREEINLIKKENEDKLFYLNEKIEDHLKNNNERSMKSIGDIQEKIAIMGVSQKKLEEVSTNILEFKNILTDKKSRGTFGEFQLEAIVSDMLPNNGFEFQYTLSNNMRADCIIKIPQSNFLVIDSKFPLENYKRMLDNSNDKNLFSDYEKKFKNDIKKHIDDISKKYIIKEETVEYALMFIPSESIFSDIHSNYLDLLDYAKNKKVWIVSPNTTMAFVFTLNSILKNENTKQQVHLIQKNLIELSKDFSRYDKRLELFFKHIEQLNEDIQQIRISGNKIINRFKNIEDVREDNIEKEEK